MNSKSGLLAAALAVWQSAALFIIYRVATANSSVQVLGLWSTAASVAGLLTIFDLGLTDLMVREVSHSAARRDWSRLKGISRTLLWISALLVGVAAVAAAAPLTLLITALSPTSAPDLAAKLAAGAVFVTWITVLQAGAAGIIEGLGRYDLKAFAGVIGAPVGVLTAVFMARTSPDVSLMTALAASGLTNLAGLLFLIAILQRRMQCQSETISGKNLRQLVKLSINIRLGSIANLGLDPFSRLMVLHYGGSETSGFYELAYRLVIQVRSILIASTQVMVPMLAQQSLLYRNGVDNLVQRLTQSSLRIAGASLWPVIMALPVVSWLVLSTSHIVVLAFGTLLAITWLLNFVAAPAYYANFVEGLLVRNRYSHLLMLALVLVLGPPLGHYFGGIGAVVATALAVTVGSLLIILLRGPTIARLVVRLPRGECVAQSVGALAAGAAIASALLMPGAYWQALTCLALLSLYLATAAGPIIGLAREHLLLVSGQLVPHPSAAPCPKLPD